MLCIQVPD
jgi:hypothetical protein